jgi:ABC-2 type transport system permease protein
MFLLGISLTIAFAFNIIIATVGFWTEMGAGYGPWFLYRHLLGAARLPDEMFPTSIRFMLTFLVPFFLMVAFPVRALFDKLSGVEMVFAASLAVAWMSFALLLWRLSIRHYTSASS